MKASEIKRRVEAGTARLSVSPSLWVRPSFQCDGRIEILHGSETGGLFQSIDIPDAEELVRAIKRASAYAKRMKRENTPARGAGA